MARRACGLEFERCFSFLEEPFLLSSLRLVDWVLLCCESVARLIPSSAASTRLLPWRTMSLEEVVVERSRGK